MAIKYPVRKRVKGPTIVNRGSGIPAHHTAKPGASGATTPKHGKR